MGELCILQALRTARQERDEALSVALLPEFLEFRRLRAEVEAMPLSGNEKLNKIKRVPTIPPMR
jgi:hypothetical protein